MTTQNVQKKHVHVKVFTKTQGRAAALPCPKESFAPGWMAVYVFCRNIQSESHSDPHDICMLSLFYQFPNCNLFIQHVVIYLMERHR
jgi:hypothetical protein